MPKNKPGNSETESKMATVSDPASQNPAEAAIESASSMSWREKIAQQAMRASLLPGLAQEQAKAAYEHLGAQKYAKHNGLEAPAGEDMGIHLGDQIINYPAQPQSQPSNAAGGLSRLGKAAVVAGAVGAGSLLPAAGQAALNWFNKPDAPAVAQPMQTPAGAFELKLVPPDPSNQ